ncbi:MAG: LLM class flavin-dependent oxidoreductase [Chloroflexi bacterium]|nr:MAG: LLM class flavin-dependent oxidoreductase [Chloroflexota bacterium]
MRYGLTVPNFGDCFDPRLLAEMAHEAEDAGWDGFFIWDHVQFMPTPTVDPWVALTAIALATRRIRLGPMVTPVPRRRPVKLARETVSLDYISDGRLVLGVGIGLGPWEWDYMGEQTDVRVRGEMLDEALDLLVRFWTGEPVLHEGHHYRFRGDFGPGRPEVNPTPLLPPPRQTPRIPIWVAGTWPRKPPFRRAARWDGVVPLGEDRGAGPRMTPEEVRDMLAYIRSHRTHDTDFDVVIGGHTGGLDRDADRATVEPYISAGATWWLEDVSPWPFGWNWHGPWPLSTMRDRIRRGPPDQM